MSETAGTYKSFIIYCKSEILVNDKESLEPRQYTRTDQTVHEVVNINSVQKPNYNEIISEYVTTLNKNVQHKLTTVIPKIVDTLLIDVTEYLGLRVESQDYSTPNEKWTISKLFMDLVTSDKFEEEFFNIYEFNKYDKEVIRENIDVVFYHVLMTNILSHATDYGNLRTLIQKYYLVTQEERDNFHNYRLLSNVINFFTEVLSKTKGTSFRNKHFHYVPVNNVFIND